MSLPCIPRISHFDILFELYCRDMLDSVKLYCSKKWHTWRITFSSPVRQLRCHKSNRCKWSLGHSLEGKPDHSQPPPMTSHHEAQAHWSDYRPVDLHYHPVKNHVDTSSCSESNDFWYGLGMSMKQFLWSHKLHASFGRIAFWAIKYNCVFTAYLHYSSHYPDRYWWHRCERQGWMFRIPRWHRSRCHSWLWWPSLSSCQ